MMRRNEVEQFKKDNPDKKLGEWNTEEVPVEKRIFNPETGESETGVVMTTRRVKYVHAPVEKIRCSDNKHTFKVLDKGRWIFGCTNCKYAKIIYPGTENVTILK